MKTKFLIQTTNELNSMGLTMQTRNRLIDLMSVTEVKAKLETLNKVLADLSVQIETLEEYLAELEGDETEVVEETSTPSYLKTIGGKEEACDRMEREEQEVQL